MAENVNNDVAECVNNDDRDMYYFARLTKRILFHRFTVIIVILFTTLICLSSGVVSLYNYTRWREVTLGQVPLSETLPIGTHWAVRVDHKFWRPYWFEVDGKTRYTEWYSSTNILSSKGATSLKGAEPIQFMGLTNKTDNDISLFNEEWKAKHPNYRFTSDNCQKYAADLIIFLCGYDAAKHLPWQEGPLAQTVTYSSLLILLLFYLVVAIILSRKEKKE